MTPHPSTRRGAVVVAVMAASFMIAIEVTIVSTALPRIAAQLGGLRLYSWVFSAFLLAQTATTVLFGKLADIAGRRPVMLAGIAIFLVGSIACGAAWSMPSLILFRLVQGLGAGAIQPLCLTIVGDLYPLEERGKVQGWLASVWGVSSVVGPLVGGLIVQHLPWAWIFWMNVPIGLGAAWGFVRYLHEAPARAERAIDTTGAALFATAVAAAMLALTEAAAAPAAVVGGLAAAALVAALLFVAQERRARDPMIDFRLWAHRPVASANVASLLSGVVMMGLTTFIPIAVQAVLMRSALVAGFALTVMVLGWPIGATIAARNFVRFGLRATLLFGAALLPAGAAMFLALGPGSSPVTAGLGSLIVGFGMGFLSTAALVTVQESVGWGERGAVTAANVFSRNLGSTLGATVLGAVLNISLTRAGQGMNSAGMRRLLESGGSGGGTGDPLLRHALADGLHVTFWSVFVVACLTLVAAWFVPEVRRRDAVAGA